MAKTTIGLNPCSVNGCENVAYYRSLGLCCAHRWRLRKYGSIDAVTPREAREAELKITGRLMNGYRLVYRPGHVEVGVSYSGPKGNLDWAFEHRVVMSDQDFL